MARAKASDVIVARLVALGYTVVTPPKTNPYHRNGGWRSAGTTCWTAEIEKDGIRADLLCWDTMALCAKVPVEKWDLALKPYNAITLRGGDYELYVKGSTSPGQGA